MPPSEERLLPCGFLLFGEDSMGDAIGSGVILSGEPTLTVIQFSILLSSLSLIIPYFYSRCSSTKQRTKTNSNNDKNDTSSAVFINPCPNPDCIRCRKYKQIQSSANRRLPHLIRQWESKQPTKLDSGQKIINRDDVDDDDVNGLQRIINGVQNSSNVNTIHN